MYCSVVCVLLFVHAYTRANDLLFLTLWTPLHAAHTLASDTREIKFFKPVNLPGLKSTRGVKLQSLRRYGNAGLILKSSTRLEVGRVPCVPCMPCVCCVYCLCSHLFPFPFFLTRFPRLLSSSPFPFPQDVPAADTFSVEDVLVVSKLPQAGAGANGDALSKIEIYFEVKFHKSTFIRWVIDSNTTTEMTKWLTAFQIHITKMSATYIHTRDLKVASIKKVFLAPTKEGGDDADSSDEEGSSNKDSGKSSGLLKVPKKITKSIKVAATQVMFAPPHPTEQSSSKCVCVCDCACVPVISHSCLFPSSHPFFIALALTCISHRCNRM